MRFCMDPRAKLYLLLLANLMLFFHVGTGAEAVATGLFLLLFFLSGHTRTGIRLSVVYFGLLAIDLFVVPLAGEGILLNLLSLVSVGIRMMLPCIITGASLCYNPYFWAAGAGLSVYLSWEQGVASSPPSSVP